MSALEEQYQTPLSYRGSTVHQTWCMSHVIVFVDGFLYVLYLGFVVNVVQTYVVSMMRLCRCDEQRDERRRKGTVGERRCKL